MLDKMRTPASKQSLDSLMQNTRDTMTELEAVFPAMMELRVHLTTIGADTIGKTDTILALFSKVEDLFIGSHFVLHELMASFRLLLDTTIVYEKRYHIQSINLGICEAYNYFMGNKNDGVWSLLKPDILALDNPILHSYILIIDKELGKLGVEYCDKDMRNSTAHYDKPIKRADLLDSIIDEDKYCKAVSQFMLIHMRISQISTIFFALISQITPNSSSTNIKQEKAIFDVKAFAEKKLAETFSSNEQLVNTSSESLTKVSNNIESLHNKHLKIEKLKEFAATQNIQLPMNIEIVYQLILLRMMVNFIRCDLTCAIRAYMESKSSIERSLHLRRIYLTEVSALTHLYGYNEGKKNESLWEQLTVIDIDRDEETIEPLQANLEELTSCLNKTRRNLDTHFREGDRLNILNRYKAYENMNQIDEVYNALNILHLCKKIEDYTMSVLERVEQQEQLKSEEQEDNFKAMFENLQNMTMQSKISDDTKSQIINMLDDMKEKTENIFKFPKK